MSAQLFHSTGEQAHTIRYRRLAEIRWEKRVVLREVATPEFLFVAVFVVALIVGLVVLICVIRLLFDVRLAAFVE